MLHLTFDFETRSRIDLIKCGTARYAEDESTDVLCLAVTFNGRTSAAWVPEKFRHLAETELSDDQLQKCIDKADTIEAHYSGFEIFIWNNVMLRYGFKKLPLIKIRCSAVKASTLNLPRALGAVGKALNLDIQKDYVGYRIMLKMCKPRKPTKNNPNEWHENPEEYQRLIEYCKTDIFSEHEASKHMKDLIPSELELFRYDRLWNMRGIPIDMKGAKILWAKLEEKEQALLTELQQLTCGAVNSAKQIAVLKAWISERWKQLPNLKKETVLEVIDDAPKEVKRALEIRQELGKSSTAKIKAMLRATSKNGRFKESLAFHGCSTGRWSGKIVQIHNLPRDSFYEDEVEQVLSMSIPELDKKYGSAMFAASKCLRGLIKAPKGMKFFCADFSAIEARTLCWLAKEKKTLQAFVKGLDVYKVEAAGIYNTTYEKVTSEQRQIGKVAVLALGYQGWVNAFNSMAVAYGVNVDEEKAKQIILAWREKNPNIVRYWKNLELAIKHTIKNNQKTKYLGIEFFIENNFLFIKLPSGRCLAYNSPQLRNKKVHGKDKMCICFMGVDSDTKQWKLQYTYGGSICENITQAVARDLLAYNLIKAEQAGYKVIMHVHDEILCEVEESRNDLKTFEKTIAQAPAWAEGCPLKAEGWVGKRYRK